MTKLALLPSISHTIMVACIVLSTNITDNRSKVNLNSQLKAINLNSLFIKSLTN